MCSMPWCWMNFAIELTENRRFALQKSSELASLMSKSCDETSWNVMWAPRKNGDIVFQMNLEQSEIGETMHQTNQPQWCFHFTLWMGFHFFHQNISLFHCSTFFLITHFVNFVVVILKYLLFWCCFTYYVVTWFFYQESSLMPHLFSNVALLVIMDCACILYHVRGWWKEYWFQHC